MMKALTPSFVASNKTLSYKMLLEFQNKWRTDKTMNATSYSERTNQNTYKNKLRPILLGLKHSNDLLVTFDLIWVNLIWICDFSKRSIGII